MGQTLEGTDDRVVRRVLWEGFHEKGKRFELCKLFLRRLCIRRWLGKRCSHGVIGGFEKRFRGARRPVSEGCQCHMPRRVPLIAVDATLISFIHPASNPPVSDNGTRHELCMTKSSPTQSRRGKSRGGIRTRKEWRNEHVTGRLQTRQGARLSYSQVPPNLTSVRYLTFHLTDGSFPPERTTTTVIAEIPFQPVRCQKCYQHQWWVF